MVATQNNDSAHQNRWLLRWKQIAHPKMRLFCLPFAGGGAFYYKPWAEILAPEIEICAIQLPGRENRLRERPLTNVDTLVPIVLDTIDPLLDTPFAFFGHSMGGIIAFEVCRELRRLEKPAPNHLFISSACAPQLPRRKPLLHLMSDSELVEQLVRYGGTPKEVLEDKDMMAMMIPLLRADFTLFETRNYIQEAPFAYPITVFGSTTDSRVSIEEMEAWKEHTSSPLRMSTFSGGHFFVKDNLERNKMLKAISDICLTQFQ